MSFSAVYGVGIIPRFCMVPVIVVYVERPVYRGIRCFAAPLYLYMCVRDAFCGAWRVRDACGVSVR